MRGSRACFVASCIALTAAAPAPAQAPALAAKPKLVVLLAIDQFGSDLFERWRGKVSSGLKRLADESILYSNAIHTHGVTETCPGHAVLLTGKTPGRNGIVGNSWYDAENGKTVYCVAAQEFLPAHEAKARKVGPTNLVTSTLGDWMKETSSESRVVVVSGKDRASIALGGRKADGVFWYEDNFGFTTFLAPGEDAAAKLAPLAALNAKIQSEKPPAWTYTNPACKALEATYKIGSTEWKSELPAMLPGKPGEEPKPARPLHIMDPLTIEAAKTLVKFHQLGARGTTDLLAVSLSATDFIGHGYGTQGPEMCDQMYRLDALIGEFLNFLTAIDPNVLVVVTGDHGGSDFPERLSLQGKSAKRVDGTAWLRSVNAELKDQLKLEHEALVSPDEAQIYIVGADKKRMQDPRFTEVRDAALKIIRARDEVAEAFLFEEVAQKYPSRKEIAEMSLRDRYAHSAMKGRSGDIFVAFKQGITVPEPRLTRFIASHSGPHDYDRRVPVIFWWPKTKAETRAEIVTPLDIAPSLAHIIGINMPSDLDGACLTIADFGTGTCVATAK